MLPVEPAPKVAVRSNLIKSGAVAEDIAVKLFRAKTRLQQCARFECRLLVKREEPATLVKVCSGVGGVEGIQIEVVDLLRKDREACSQPVVVVDDVVDP